MQRVRSPDSKTCSLTRYMHTFCPSCIVFVMELDSTMVSWMSDWLTSPGIKNNNFCLNVL
jgi:hypothetical protein